MSETQGQSTPAVEQPTAQVAEAKADNTVAQAKVEAAKAEALRKYKLQVNGKEQELEISDDDIPKYLQKGLAADRKFEEAAKARKEAQEAIELLSKDPELLFKHKGVDAKEWATQYLLNIIERESMPAEQRELLETKEKLSTYEERERKRIELENQIRVQAAHQAAREQLDREVAEAMAKSKVIPRTEYSISRIASYLHDAAVRNIDITVDDAVKLVEEDYIKERNSLIDLPEEELLELFPEEKRRKLNETYVKKHVKQPNGIIQKTTTPVKPAQQQPKQSWSEWSAQNRARFAGQ